MRMIERHRAESALEARPEIDAVLIATGDRWHAPASMLAAQAGKDVYSEKPCGLTIADCQNLADTINHFGRVFQAGTQRRSVPNFQQAVQLAHSGKLGKIHTLYASVYTPQIESQWLPGEPTPPRDVCDWNLWLGPAPWRPYNGKYVAGGWRGYYDFDSIMHYGPKSFAVLAADTLETVPVGIPIGQRTALSGGDIDSIQHNFRYSGGIVLDFGKR